MKCEYRQLSTLVERKIGYGIVQPGSNQKYGVPIIKVNNIIAGLNNIADLDCTTEEISAKYERTKLRGGELIISVVGTIGKTAIVPKSFAGCNLVRATAMIDIPNLQIAKWVKYYIDSPNGQAYIHQNLNTTVQATLNIKSLSEMPIPFYSDTQMRRIIAILECLDDKIELNNKINENLEQQAQAIYQEWFVSQVDNHPDNYRKVSLADLMDYTGGSQPPASEFISEEREGYIRFVQIRDYESDSHLTYIPISTKNKICNEFDIMIARYGAALGRICFGLNGAYNVALAKVIPKQTYYREFLRCYLSSSVFYEGINNKGGRSAQAGFNQSDIKSFELFVPHDESVFHMFDAIVKPVFEYRLQLIKENKELTLLRNVLLPSLMAGKIDISSIYC